MRIAMKTLARYGFGAFALLSACSSNTMTAPDVTAARAAVHTTPAPLKVGGSGGEHGGRSGYMVVSGRQGGDEEGGEHER